MPQKILCSAYKTSQGGISSILPSPTELAGQSICVVLVSVSKKYSVSTSSMCVQCGGIPPDKIGVMTYIWCPLRYCVVYIVMVFLLDQTSVAVLHSTAPLSDSHLIHREREGGLGLLGYWLVISNRGINFVSDGITTIINRSAPSSPFNFPQMIEKKYIGPAFIL